MIEDQKRIQQLERELSEAYEKFSLERGEYVQVISNLIANKSQNDFELSLFKQNAQMIHKSEIDENVGGTDNES